MNLLCAIVVFVRAVQIAPMPAFSIAARFLAGVLSPFFGTWCTTILTSAPVFAATSNAESTGPKLNSYIAARSW
jgi:hypothetical protein